MLAALLGPHALPWPVPRPDLQDALVAGGQRGRQYQVLVEGTY